MSLLVNPSKPNASAPPNPAPGAVAPERIRVNVAIKREMSSLLSRTTFSTFVVEAYTSNLALGLVVPTPTLPEESTISPVPPTVSNEENRLVELAVVENKLVVVALVVVELPVMRRLPAMVEEAEFEMKPALKPRIVEVETPQDVGVQANGSPEPPMIELQPKRPVVLQIRALLAPLQLVARPAPLNDAVKRFVELKCSTENLAYGELVPTPT